MMPRDQQMWVHRKRKPNGPWHRIMNHVPKFHGRWMMPHFITNGHIQSNHLSEKIWGTSVIEGYDKQSPEEQSFVDTADSVHTYRKPRKYWSTANIEMYKDAVEKIKP